MRLQHKTWRDLSAPTKARIMTLGIVQVLLLAAALWDIAHRPAEEIKGNKPMWVGLAFVNYIGPLAYFLLGRKPPTPVAPTEPIGYG
jgi:hypothetical protein